MNDATTTRGERAIPANAVHALGGAGALALGAVFVALVLAPLQQRRAQASEDAANLSEAQASLASTDAKISAARKQVETLQRQLADSVQLQSPQSVNRVVQQVTDAASAAGLEVAQVTPGEKSASVGREFAVVPIHLVATGTFAQTIGFLEQSNRAFRDVATRGMSVRRVESDVGKVQVTLDLAWHTLPADNAAQNGRNESAGGN